MPPSLMDREPPFSPFLSLPPLRSFAFNCRLSRLDIWRIRFCFCFPLSAFTGSMTELLFRRCTSLSLSPSLPLPPTPLLFSTLSFYTYTRASPIRGLQCESSACQACAESTRCLPPEFHLLPALRAASGALRESEGDEAQG